MLDRIANLLITNIDDITREWVEDLRSSERTQIHKQLLTAEIVNGMKSLLANLAETLSGREQAREPRATGSLSLPGLELNELPGGSTRRGRPKGTAPLTSPLVRAIHTATSHGRYRHSQGAEIHEIVLEFVRLRQIIMRKLVEGIEAQEQAELALSLPAFDLLFDELLLLAVEHFHHSSVHDLEKRAIHDPLTQLYNKDYFGQRMGEEMRRALRSSEALTLAMIDMDRLKWINDTFGHAAGDAVIEAVANTIRDSCRRGDVPCRVGGDEFAVILPETNKARAGVFAERVVRNLHDMSVVVSPGGGAEVANPTIAADRGKRPLMVPVPTVSIGLASFPEDARNPETLMAKADAALYRAKGEGRNRIAI